MKHEIGTKGWGYDRDSKTAKECILLAYIPTSYLPFICIEKQYFDKYESGEKCMTTSFKQFSEEKPEHAGTFRQVTHQQICEALGCSDFEILPF